MTASGLEAEGAARLRTEQSGAALGLGCPGLPLVPLESVMVEAVHVTVCMGDKACFSAG